MPILTQNIRKGAQLVSVVDVIVADGKQFLAVGKKSQGPVNISAFDAQGLIDTGATNTAISKEFVEKDGLLSIAF